MENQTNEKVYRDVFTLDRGMVVMLWPKSISREDFEDFEEWWKIMLRKVGRAVDQTDASP